MEPSADLLGTEVLAEPDLDEIPIGRGESLVAATPGSSPAGEVIRERRPIGTVLLDVAAHLTADGAAVSAEHPSDLGLVEPLFPQH